jgi:hypothetical protein
MQGKQCKNPQKRHYPKFWLHLLIRAQKLKSVHRSMANLTTHRSTVDKRSRTPPTVLSLMVGGGGGGGLIWRLKRVHISTVDLLALRSMSDRKFQTPPTILSLMVGGGGPIWAVFPGEPHPNVAQIYYIRPPSILNHLLLTPHSDILPYQHCFTTTAS